MALGKLTVGCLTPWNYRIVLGYGIAGLPTAHCNDCFVTLLDIVNWSLSYIYRLSVP